MVAWAKAKCPDVNGRLSTETFVAYWRGESGAKATKRDWTQAWRVWLLRDQTNATRGRRDRASPPALLERDGIHLNPRNAALAERRSHWQRIQDQIDASGQLALGGTT